MAKVSVRVKGLKELEAAFGPKFVLSLRKKVRKANLVLAVRFQTQLRKTIGKSNLYHKNDIVTTIIKGSNKPLNHTGKLVDNVDSKIVQSGWGFDVWAQKLGGNGQDITALLHWGGNVAVTEGHRKFFYAMFKKTSGAIKPLKKSTTHLFIPARPYMLYAFKKGTGTRRLLNKYWNNAVARAFKQASGKPGAWRSSGGSMVI